MRQKYTYLLQVNIFRMHKTNYSDGDNDDGDFDDNIGDGDDNVVEHIGDADNCRVREGKGSSRLS